MKCKKKVEISNPKKTVTKRGTIMYKGKCPLCETVVCKFGKE